MKKIYLLILTTFAFVAMNAQLSGFRAGWVINYNAPVGGAANDSNFYFSQSWAGTPKDVWTPSTGNITSTPTGTVTLTKKDQGGASGFFVRCNKVGYTAIDPDMINYPFMMMRIRSSATAAVPTTFTMKAGSIALNASITLKGNNEWQVVKVDYGNQTLGYIEEGAWTFNEPLTGITYPYTIEIDYIKLGNVADIDPATPVTFSTIKDTLVEKDAGEQLITIKGITGGADVAKLSLSQTNTKASLFQSISFEAINLVDSTATLKITPKPGTIGVANVTVLLTYNSGDTLKKYKARTFKFEVIADPKMTVGTLSSAQYNQPKATINITGATNSTGGSSGLEIEVTTDNPDVITTLVAQAVANDGTSKITWVPASDKCGSGTITATIKDIVTERTAQYTIEAKVKDADGGDCVVIATESAAASEFSVSPNPASEKVIISMPNIKGGIINIIDITGSNVAKISVQPGQELVTVNISDLTAGVYFVVLEGSQKVKKMIVK